MYWKTLLQFTELKHPLSDRKHSKAIPENRFAVSKIIKISCKQLNYLKQLK